MDVLTISKSGYVDAIFSNTYGIFDFSKSGNFIKQSTFKLKYSTDSEAICKFVEYCHNGKRRDVLINIRNENRHVIFNDFKIINYEKQKISDEDYFIIFTSEYNGKEFLKSEDSKYRKIIRLNKIINLLNNEESLI